MLAMSQSRDPGPLADEFGGSALRCGRILERSSSVCHFLFTGHLFVEITVISIGEDNFLFTKQPLLYQGLQWFLIHYPMNMSSQREDL